MHSGSEVVGSTAGALRVEADWGCSEDASVGVMLVVEVVSVSTTRFVGRRILDAKRTKGKERLGEGE